MYLSSNTLVSVLNYKDIEFIDKFSLIINLHPALHGQFDGINAVERGFNAFKEKKVSKLGVMVHVVIPEVDKGKIVLERQVHVHENDSLDSYSARLKLVEHDIIVQSVKLLIENNFNL